MEKSTLKITRTEQTVTVKKKPSILLVVIYIVAFAACVGLPFLFSNAWNKPLLWGLLICCLAANCVCTPSAGSKPRSWRSCCDRCSGLRKLCKS